MIGSQPHLNRQLLRPPKPQKYLPRHHLPKKPFPYPKNPFPYSQLVSGAKWTALPIIRLSGCVCATSLKISVSATPVHMQQIVALHVPRVTRFSLDKTIEPQLDRPHRVPMLWKGGNVELYHAGCYFVPYGLKVHGQDHRDTCLADPTQYRSKMIPGGICCHKFPIWYLLPGGL